MKIAVLLSGTGRSLANLIGVIQRGHLPVEIATVVSTTPKALGLKIATNAGIPVHVVTSGENQNDELFSILDQASVDLVCMAGWLRKVAVPERYKDRIMNIHPSLLPSFGGEGYYGSRVHEAVLQRGCKVSGCTVHFVDDNYDHGPIILQKSVPVLEKDDAKTLAERVFAVECWAYPEAIRLFALRRLLVRDQCVRVLPG